MFHKLDTKLNLQSIASAINFEVGLLRFQLKSQSFNYFVVFLKKYLTEYRARWPFKMFRLCKPASHRLQSRGWVAVEAGWTAKTVMPSLM